MKNFIRKEDRTTSIILLVKNLRKGIKFSWVGKSLKCIILPDT